MPDRRFSAAHGPPGQRWELWEVAPDHWQLWHASRCVDWGSKCDIRNAYANTFPADHWLRFIFNMIVASYGPVEIRSNDDRSYSLLVVGWEMIRGDRDSVVSEYNKFLPYDALPPSN